ncbi:MULTISPECIES: hypothetical protein [unclassified Streptomyces]|uniref:hypothetical protein n=1 Tax=unclassified Streptomyces TaxID=2593676 RepID=UPI00403C4CC2
MSTLRALESKDLAERTPNSARAAYAGGLAQDRVRLTPAGITVLASVIGLPLTEPPATLRTTPPPSPSATQATARSH